jgi:hypothetical protein
MVKRGCIIGNSHIERDEKVSLPEKRCLETSDRKYTKTNCKINPSIYEINLLRQVGELYCQLA